MFVLDVARGSEGAISEVRAQKNVCCDNVLCVYMWEPPLHSNSRRPPYQKGGFWPFFVTNGRWLQHGG